jgi:hypothetical protein
MSAAIPRGQARELRLDEQQEWMGRTMMTERRSLRKKGSRLTGEIAGLL